MMLLKLVLFIKKIRPSINGLIFKIFFTSKRIKVGKNFKCNKLPSLLIDKNCNLKIGNNVLFRKDVEIRVHNSAQIIIEDNVRIDRGVRLLAANNSKIHIRSKARIGLYTVFNGGDSIDVGENTLISGFVYLQTSMHRHSKGELIQNQGYSHLPVKLHNDVWLGTHVVILPGVELKEGTVVGSNAVVTKSFEKNTILGGVPAKILKER